MRMMLKTAILVLLMGVVPSLTLAESVREAQFGLGVGVSNLGLTADVSNHITPHVGLRALGAYGGMSGTKRIGAVDFSATLRTGGVGPMIDIYPFADGWRFTGGAFVPLSRVSLSANGPIQIDNRLYAHSDLHATLTPRSRVQPMVTVGYDGGLFAREKKGRGFSRVGLAFDVGATRSSGHNLSLEDRSGLILREDLEKVVRDVNQRLNTKGWIPFVRLGMRMHF